MQVVDTKIRGEFNDDAINDSDNEDDAMDETFLRERDQCIQQEIHRLQTENLRLEKQWQSQAKKDIQQIEATSRIEEQQLLIQQQRLTSSTSEAILSAQQLDQEAKEIAQQLASYEQQEQNLRQQERELEESCRSTRQRIAQFQALRRRDDEEESHLFESDRRALQQDFDALSQQRVREQQELDRKLRVMEGDYDEELERLDSQVKQQVSAIDADILHCKEQLAAEQIAVDRLRRLIDEYQP
jgi:hypothetical protein